MLIVFYELKYNTETVKYLSNMLFLISYQILCIRKPYQKIRTLNLSKKVKTFFVLFATNVHMCSPYT